MQLDTLKKHDNVNAPKHYCSHKSGVECIEIAEMLPFNLGNALKYLWRKGKKLDEVEDIKKAIFYLRRQANSDLECTYVSHTSRKLKKISDLVSRVSKVDKRLADIAGKICYGDKVVWKELANLLEQDLK